MDFYCIYIQEAHPDDGWQLRMNQDQKVVFNQPAEAAERAEVAAVCMLKLSFEMPMLLDRMSNEVDSAYAALPERLYVIDSRGSIAYRGEMGPWGFDPDSWERAIEVQLGV